MPKGEVPGGRAESGWVETDWVGIDREVWGMQEAWRNLQGDSASMASYVYDRMSAHRGTDHPGVCRIILQRLVDIVAGPYERSEDQTA